MSEKTIDDLVEKLSNLTVLDMSKLKEALEDKWGVKAAAGAPMMMAAPAAGGADSADAEATDFQVILKEFPPEKKISVIKAIREISTLGLKEAKELVESAPKAVNESSPKAEAEEMAKKLTDAGAKIELKAV